MVGDRRRHAEDTTASVPEVGRTTPAKGDEVPDEVAVSTVPLHEVPGRHRHDTAGHRGDPLVHRPHHQTWEVNELVVTRWAIAYSDGEV